MLPRYVIGIISVLRAAGFSAYAVGGCVRDILLSRRPCDWDVATSAGCETVMSLFRKTVPTGIDYGTVTVFNNGGKAEVTTFRSDGTYPDGRHPERVRFVSDIEDDLSRRDFTINAMAMSPDGEIFDPYCGRMDIEQKIIRCVGDPQKRFSEDALRMFRAIRFSAQLGFELEAETKKAISDCAGLCEKLSAERVQIEIAKTLASPSPEAVKYMIEQGLMSKYLQMQKRKTLPNFENIRILPRKGDFRWCAFAAGLKEYGYVSDIEEFLRLLRCPVKRIRDCAEAAELAKKLPADTMGHRFFLAEHGEDKTLFAAAANIVFDPVSYRRAREAIRRGGYVQVPDLAVSGDDIKNEGLCGKDVGYMLKELSRMATANEIENSHDELMAYVKGKIK